MHHLSRALVAGTLTGLAFAQSPVPHDVAGTGFVQNRGQWASKALYRAAGNQGDVWVTSTGWTLTVSGRPDDAAPSVEDPLGKGPAPAQEIERYALRLDFVGAGSTAIRAGSQKSTRHHFIGASGETVTTRAFDRLIHEDVWAGVEVVLRGAEHGLAAYDVLLDRASSLGDVVLKAQGGKLSLDADGQLRLQTPVGALTQSAPIAWQTDASGERRNVNCAFHLLGPDTYTFRIGAHDPNRPLVIDPDLLWSSFHGGTDEDGATCMKQDDDGTWIFGGYTASNNFPVVNGVLARAGARDLWVGRIDPSAPPAGQLLWSTTIGGSEDDVLFDLEINDLGAIVMTGYTESPNFPTTVNAPQPRWGGGMDAYLAMLVPAGNVLISSTYIGGSGFEWACAVELDSADQPTIAAYSTSANLPVVNGQRASTRGDVYLARLDQLATRFLWGTFYGGTAWQGSIWGGSYVNFPPNIRTMGLDLDSRDRLAVTGLTGGAPYQTTSCGYSPRWNSSWDVFVSVVDPSQPSISQQLVWSTTFGGDQGESGMDIAWLDDARVAIAGYTYSPNFPTTPGAFQQSNAGQNDAFVAYFDTSLCGAATLLYSTYIGGTDFESPYALDVDARGFATFCGYCFAGYPTTPGAFDRSNPGRQDGFITTLRPSGRGTQDLVYSTYYGGDIESDILLTVEALPCGGAISAGFSRDPNLPIQGGFQPGLSGGDDAMFARFGLLPVPATREGGCTSHCDGTPFLDVDRQPFRGQPVEFLIGGAAPNAPGVIAFSGTPTGNCLPVLGADICLPFPLWVTVPVVADPQGFVSQAIPMPPTYTPTKGQFGVQAIMVSAPTCSQPLSSSAALCF